MVETPRHHAGTGAVATTILVSLACTMWVADEQITPALFRDIGRSFGLSPSELGALVFARAITQAISAGFAGLLGAAHRHRWRYL